ncbi:right-handed parallel beta-helix repeat-containing protein [Clostridium lacusfryxellense]|uniref:right-handed parallel beta-helix repeat-containing protein n=1 Tax=Clostridium lacusfryxellense TaxID=205328 RepID=UPI001C0B1C91|nr:right-handed parallel beta-helix repeat-containing protein [Clostridium lacusfryxellense]MBU3111075.1 right-handed parallel beta-helix repeat-containing protein [Clostridium lacusfryxellense]
MLKTNFKKSITAIIILISIATVTYFIINSNAGNLTSQSDDLTTNVVDSIAPNDPSILNPSITTVTPSVTQVVTKNPTIIDAQNYNLDITGRTDTSAQLQTMMDSLPKGVSIKLPKGTYKIVSIVKLKDNITIIASNDVIFRGVAYNTLFSTGNNNIFQGISFQNCATALRVFHKNGLEVINCRFTSNIKFSAINFYGASDSSVINSYFAGIRKYGILIDNDSSDITIDNNNFDNAEVFGGYKKEQIGGHVYCLNGTNIKVTNNILKNSGGQGVIFGYNSTTGKGTTNSVASNNKCEGNGQEGATIYGGSKKVTSGNSIINNTSKNNRFNQIEVWQSNNNIVRGNTVAESITGIGNLGAICLFDTAGTTVTGNNILSAQNNGIAIIAGTTNTTVSDNYIADTNKKNDINTPEMGNGILLDWNGKSDPKYITITSNVISSSSAIIDKSGVYSTSKSNHNNEINNNIITGYTYGVNWYALLTCG